MPTTYSRPLFSCPADRDCYLEDGDFFNMIYDNVDSICAESGILDAIVDEIEAEENSRSKRRRSWELIDEWYTTIFGKILSDPNIRNIKHNAAIEFSSAFLSTRLL